MADLIDRQAALDALEEYADRLQMVDWKENPGVPYKAYALNWCINTIRDLPSAHHEMDEWCTDCKEYDHEHHCCPRFNRVIREALSERKTEREVETEFINWLLDEIWDEELWELNYRAFPELLCRRLVKAGWLKEEGGKYVRLDKQTGGD